VPLFAVVLRNLRERAGWTQTRLEREARLSKGAVCRLEKGDQTIDRFLLDRLARVLGIGEGDVERAITALGEFPAPAPVQESPADLPSRDWQTIEAVSSRFSRRVRKKTQDRTGSRLGARRWRAAREAAGEAWQRLRKVPSGDRRSLVETVESYQTWAVVERLCEESARAASNDVDESRRLAQLARWSAASMSGTEDWRNWLQGYAAAFEANAWCAAGELRQSQIIFSEAEVLLRAEVSASQLPMDQTRPLHLYAVLLKYLGEFDHALSRLEEAFAMARTPLQKARILINRASVLKRKRLFGEALDSLAEARRCAESAGDSRLRWAIAFNEAAYMCEAGEGAAIVPKLDALRTAALQLGRNLDMVRLRWLIARVAAATGKLPEASVALREVWEFLAQRRLWLDAALAVLELASIELEQGQTREVKVLATASVGVFVALTLPEELLAAIRLFWEAARKEAASATTAQHLVRELRRARGEDVEAP
jgi:transcriptional regulator with XRE-family HTH domain